MFENYKKSRSLRKQTKLFEDEKFDIDEEGRGIIEIGAGDYSDIFSYYSLNNYNVLDSEFNAFLETKADAIPMKHELTLNFHVKNPIKSIYSENILFRCIFRLIAWISRS